MKRGIIYQIHTWPDFSIAPDKLDSTWVVLPDRDHKANGRMAFPELDTHRIITVSDLISTYLQRKGESGILSLQTVEAVLGPILTNGFTDYLRMEQYRQSYVRALAELIHNFRSSSLVDLKTALRHLKPGRLSLKEKDLIRIYEAYTIQLPNHGYDLQRGILDFAACVDENRARSLLGLAPQDDLLFYGFDTVSPLETELIAAAFEQLSGTGFVCCIDPDASEQAMRIGQSLKPLLKRLKSLGAEQTTLPTEESSPFITLSNQLFNARIVPDSIRTRPETAASAYTFTANSRYQEVLSIARHVRRLIQAGISPADIRIVAPEYDRYTALFKEAFPEYGIPYVPELGTPLLRYPLARTLLSLVSQGTSQNPYSQRQKIFSSPYITFEAPLNIEVLADFQKASDIELLSGEQLSTCFVPGIYALDYSYLKQLQDKAYKQVKPSPGTPVLEVIRRLLMETESGDLLQVCLLRSLTQFCLLSKGEKALTLQTRLSGEAFAASFCGLIAQFHVAENIAACPDAIVLETDRQILAQIHQALDEISSGDACERKTPLAELTTRFTRMLEQAMLPSRSDSAAVSVQPIWGQYRPWRVTFLCGLVDGEFPSEEKYNFLEPRQDGFSLCRPYTSVDYGRSQFYNLVRNTTEALYLSRPLSEGGKRLSPSSCLLEIQKWIPDGPLGEETEPLASLREQLLFMGRHADLEFDKVRPLLLQIKETNPSYARHLLEILRFDGLTQNISLSEYDGLMSPSAAPQLKEALAGIEFIPEQLERYAACPFRFFFDDILGLKHRPDYHPDTTDTGRLIRSLLKAYTEKAAAAGGLPKDAPSILMEALNAYAQDEEPLEIDAFQHRFIRSLTAGLDNPAHRPKGVLAAFLEYEEKCPDRLLPYHSALKDTISLEDGLRIWVEIDRIDLAPDTGCLLPFRYTLSDTGNAAGIRRGLRFDLPLMVSLLMEYIERHGLNYRAAGAGLYLVKSAKLIRRTGYFADSSIRASRQNSVNEHQPIFSGRSEGFLELEVYLQALVRCREHLIKLYRLMQKGVFHLPLCHPVEQICATCAFGRVCRKEPLRLERLRSQLSKDPENQDKLNLIQELF